MKTILSLLLFLFSFSAFAQIPEPAMLWLKGYGGNDADGIGAAVVKTIDGGFIIGIGTNSFGTIGNIDSFCLLNGYRTIFLNYNSNATTLEWSKCFLTNGDTSLDFIFPNIGGSNVLGGQFNSSNGWGFYICKQDALGNILWSHNYSKGNSPLLYDMIATSDGGYLMVGDVYYTDTNFRVHNSGSLNADIGVLKLDSLGNKVWSRAIGGSNDDNGNKVIEIPGGGYYIVGNTESNDSDCTGKHLNYDAYLVRLDVNGNILWHHDLGGDGADNGNYACADGKGGIIIGGTSSSSNGDVHHYAGGGSDYWALDVDSSNNILWDNCFGGAGNAYVVSICKATDGSIWINGLSNGQGGEIDTVYDVLNGDAWLVHADSAGNFLNAKVLGSTGYDKGTMVYPLSNGSVLAGGFYSDNNGSFDSLTYYGGSDAFLAIFSPATSGIKQINTINNSVKIYPNPANDEVKVETANKNNSEIAITDVLGRIIYGAKLKGEIKIQVTDWKKGIYFVQVISDGGYKEVQKLIVQ